MKFDDEKQTILRWKKVEEILVKKCVPLKEEGIPMT